MSAPHVNKPIVTVIARDGVWVAIARCSVCLRPLEWYSYGTMGDAMSQIQQCDYCNDTGAESVRRRLVTGTGGVG